MRVLGLFSLSFAGLAVLSACESATEVWVENRYNGAVTVSMDGRGREFAPGETSKLFGRQNKDIEQLTVVTEAGEQFTLEFADDTNVDMNIIVDGPPLHVTVEMD